MPEQKIGTREEWQAARSELAKLEAEQAERNEEINRKRLDLPWVSVEKEYEFDTEDGKKTRRAFRRALAAARLTTSCSAPDYTLGAAAAASAISRRC